MEDQPRSRSPQILLIIVGAVIVICLICGIGAYVILRAGQSQAEKLTTLMAATLVQSGGAGPYFGFTNEPFNQLGTAAPASTHRPALTIYPYDPTLTPKQILPESARCVPDGEQERALLIKVISGDTIQVAVHEQTWMVRYIGIASPEMKLKPAPLAIEATVANQNLLQNRVVVLMKDVEDIDLTKTYMLRYVFAGDIFLNNEMVRLGLAQARSDPPNTACDMQFQSSQQSAMNERWGLWKDLQPSATARTLCDCQGPALTCEDFTSQTEAQTCYEACELLGFEDIFKLDSDGNGIACDVWQTP